MQRCTGLDELILSVNDSRIFRCGRCAGDGCPRMENFLDRPLIHANLSQSHSVPSLPLRGLLNRKRSAECWTRASALSAWLEETQGISKYEVCAFAFKIKNYTTDIYLTQASAEARVQHLAERWRLDTSILFRVCESEEVEMRLAKISVD